MGAKRYITADYIPWDTCMNLIRRLYADGNYRMSLLIGCGAFFGLRISDLLTLKWCQLIGADSFVVWEKKTGKRREIRINKGFQAHIKDCMAALGVTDVNEPCFLNRYGGVISVQRINRALKEVKVKYQLRSVQHLSTHSLRKTFGRHVVEMAPTGQADMFLIRLSEIYGHVSVAVTRRYLGLRQEELGEVYDCLVF